MLVGFFLIILIFTLIKKLKMESIGEKHFEDIDFITFILFVNFNSESKIQFLWFHNVYLSMEKKLLRLKFIVKGD